MVLLPFIYGLLALFLTSTMWKRGDKWWQTAIVFAFCYMGLVAATIAFFYVSSPN